MPLDFHVRASMDEGKPIVVAEPQHRISQLYLGLAREVLQQLAQTETDAAASTSGR